MIQLDSTRNFMQRLGETMVQGPLPSDMSNFTIGELGHMIARCHNAIAGGDSFDEHNLCLSQVRLIVSDISKGLGTTPEPHVLPA